MLTNTEMVRTTYFDLDITFPLFLVCVPPHTLLPLLELIKVSEIEPEEIRQPRMNTKRAPAVGMSPGYSLSLP